MINYPETVGCMHGQMDRKCDCYMSPSLSEGGIIRMHNFNFILKSNMKSNPKKIQNPNQTKKITTDLFSMQILYRKFDKCCSSEVVWACILLLKRGEERSGLPIANHACLKSTCKNVKISSGINGARPILTIFPWVEINLF